MQASIHWVCTMCKIWGIQLKAETPCPCWLSKLTILVDYFSNLFSCLPDNIHQHGLHLIQAIYAWDWGNTCDNLRWPLWYPASLSAFPLCVAVCSSGKNTSIWSPHPHRTNPGTGHAICICEMEQNETGNPMLGGFSLGSTASHRQPQRPPEK